MLLSATNVHGILPVREITTMKHTALTSAIISELQEYIKLLLVL
jgi:hypothetical protein